MQSNRAKQNSRNKSKQKTKSTAINNPKLKNVVNTVT